MNARTIARIATVLLLAAGQVAGAVGWRDSLSATSGADVDCCCAGDCTCTGGCCSHNEDSRQDEASEGSRSEASISALEACRFPTAAAAQAAPGDSFKSISSDGDLPTAPRRASVRCTVSSLNLPRDDRPASSSPRAPPTARP